MNRENVTPVRRSRRSTRSESEEDKDLKQPSVSKKSSPEKSTKKAIDNQKQVNDKSEPKLNDKLEVESKKSITKPELKPIPEDTTKKISSEPPVNKTPEKTTIEKVIESDKLLTTTSVDNEISEKSPKLDLGLVNNPSTNNLTEQKSDEVEKNVKAIENEIKPIEQTNGQNGNLKGDDMQVDTCVNGDQIKRKIADTDLDSTDEPAKKHLKIDETTKNNLAVKESNGIEHNSTASLVN